MSSADVPAGGGRLALVTGGAGFIGSHLTEELLASGWRVRVLDDLSSGSLDNLAAVAGDVEIVRADVADSTGVAEAASGVEVIYHEAAIASVPRSIEDPVGTHRVNLLGTLCVLEAARRQGCRRVIFASSSAVYGNAFGAAATESDLPAPISPYAAQKLASESYLGVYAATHGLETVALRYFNVYGARQIPGSDYAAVIPIFVDAALGGRPLEVHGDGEQTRDFVHVSDVARANRIAADAPAASGRVFNLACGTGIRVLDLVGAIARAVGRELEIRHGPPRAGDVRRSEADVAAARAVLGFSPGVDLDAGIRHTIEALGGPGAARRR